MKTCYIVLSLLTVILIYQVRSQDDVEFKALSSEEFVPLGETVWLNCSTPNPNITVYKSRLRKNNTQMGSNWLAVQVIVSDWENSTLYCALPTDENVLLSPIIVMAYAVPSKVTIDLETELEEGKEHTISCTVSEVAPLEFLTINITRGGDVIDSKSYKGPHVVNRTTVSSLHVFKASRSDHLMSFSCEAILQLGPNTYKSKSPEINVTTYTLPEAPVITVQEFIENGTPITAECLVANGFPPENITLHMFIGDIRFEVTSHLKIEGAVKGTFLLNATLSRLGQRNITCESEFFNLYKENTRTVTIYELPDMAFTLSRNIVDLGEKVTAACHITNKRPEDWGLVITVDATEELRGQNSTLTHIVTASRRTPKLTITCTTYITGNTDISRSSTQTLQVHYPPEFTESLCPSTLLLVEGETTFLCQADGNPEAAVDCSAEGRNINGTVTVTRDMSGIYTCQAKNEKGNAMKSVHVTVQYAPESPTVTVSANATVRAGNPLNITCKSDGLPDPKYSWQIPQNAEVIYAPDKSSIIIHTAAWTHNGTYICVARNAHGKADAKQEVIVVPDELNIGLIVGLAVSLAVLVAIISSVWYVLWKKGRKGFYELLRPSRRQCHQNGNIPSEVPANNTTTI